MGNTNVKLKVLKNLHASKRVPFHSMEERRRLERFDLRVPADIECLAPIKYKLSGQTRNICAGGAYFDTTINFPESTRLKLNLFVNIMGTEDMPPTQVQIDVRGSVLRSERTWMAVRFDEDYHMMPLAGAEES